MQIAVLGAGIAGLAASLALARDGHHVHLLERDALHVDSPEGAFDWERKGIPHFLQPHAFAPRGRKEMLERFPDVYDTLIAAGASDFDLRPKLPGAPQPGDEDLQYLAARRPLIEWGLRRAVLAQDGVTVRDATHVEGWDLESGNVTAVRTDAGAIRIDLVVDAMGRRSPAREWLGTERRPVIARDDAECGVIYYSRYYRLRDGAELPDGPWLLSPRGDLGYMGFSTFPGDNRTFGVVFAVPSTVHDLRVLKDEPVFEAMVARVPSLAMWRNPEICDPITPVLPMGNLHNTLNRYDTTTPTNVFPAGDSLAHTDPVLALGLSFAMMHARAITDALRVHQDVQEASRAYLASVMPDVKQRYAYAVALDDGRLRFWTGGQTDTGQRKPDAALFSFVAGGVASMVDGDIARIFMRRIGLLDPLSVLDENAALQQRIQGIFSDVMSKPRPPMGPSREEFDAIVAGS